MGKCHGNALVDCTSLLYSKLKECTCNARCNAMQTCASFVHCTKAEVLSDQPLSLSISPSAKNLSGWSPVPIHREDNQRAHAPSTRDHADGNKKAVTDSTRDRTANLRLRRPTPYPLGHRAFSMLLMFDVPRSVAISFESLGVHSAPPIGPQSRLNSLACGHHSSRFVFTGPWGPSTRALARRMAAAHRVSASPQRSLCSAQSGR